MIVCILAHITRRIDSWLLIQIINLKPRVICKYNFAITGKLADGSRLDHCVFLKGFAIFHNISLNPGFFHRYHFCIQICQDFTDFFHFICISCCKNNFFHDMVPSFFSWDWLRFEGFGPRNW